MTDYDDSRHRAKHYAAKGALVFLFASAMPAFWLVPDKERMFYLAIGLTSFGWALILSLGEILHTREGRFHPRRMGIHASILFWLIFCSIFFTAKLLEPEWATRFRLICWICAPVPFFAMFDHARCALRIRKAVGKKYDLRATA